MLVTRKRPVPASLNIDVSQSNVSNYPKRLKSASSHDNLVTNNNNNNNSSSTGSGCLTPTEPSSPAGAGNFKNSNSIHGCDSNLQTDKCTHIGAYKVIGQAGDEKRWIVQKDGGQLRIAEPLTSTQYRHLTDVTARLDAHEKFWPFPDGDAIRNAIVPYDTDLVKDCHGRHYHVSPVEHGSLHFYVHDYNRSASLSTAQKLSLVGRLYVQIVQIAAFCHAAGIVMRDLRLRKFGFADRHKTQLRLLNIDDLYILPDSDQDLMHDRHGCPAYVSPEILDLSQSVYSGKSADLWSLGVLLYVMLTGRYPFYDTTAGRLFEKIRACRYDIPHQSELQMPQRILIGTLLRLQPTERTTAAQLLATAWLQTGLTANQRVAQRLKAESGSTLIGQDDVTTKDSFHLDSDSTTCHDDVQVVPDV